jgi:transposase
VINVAILSSIRRWHLRDQMPIREITRRTGLSRNTIRKYLANKVVEPKYPHRRTPSKLDDYAAKLTAWLKTEAGKGRKQKRSIKQLHRDLVQHHCHIVESGNDSYRFRNSSTQSGKEGKNKKLSTT